ncbi:hypothetical protein CVT24_004141 [Panaeolus cyanescens]|uniref:Uncharacterized protein n=1 Tax=Panaeolus cyanescens TaxID=181874 RepID=A0A409WYS3_9AGAR|nr:hypothetical protein CVT24_004141 [Panaeolus cyanescens]
MIDSSSFYVPSSSPPPPDIGLNLPSQSTQWPESMTTEEECHCKAQLAHWDVNGVVHPNLPAGCRRAIAILAGEEAEDGAPAASDSATVGSDKDTDVHASEAVEDAERSEAEIGSDGAVVPAAEGPAVVEDDVVTVEAPGNVVAPSTLSGAQEASQGANQGSRGVVIGPATSRRPGQEIVKRKLDDDDDVVARPKKEMFKKMSISININTSGAANVEFSVKSSVE